MEHGECLAANPRIYGQLVATLEKYSKFAGAGDKASVRHAPIGGADDDTPAAGSEPAAPAAKPTLKAKRIKADSAGAPAVKAADAPF